MTDVLRRLGRLVGICGVGVIAAGCGGGSSPDAAGASATRASASEAAQSDVYIAGAHAGASPFIAMVDLEGASTSAIVSVQFIVSPQSGTVSNPVNVTYSMVALGNRGYFHAKYSALTVPVYGLYANHLNQITINLRFSDGSAQALSTTFTTAAYRDPNGIYDHPTILVARSPGVRLGFSFMALKAWAGPPVIVDTDGNVRWVGSGVGSSISSIVSGDRFVIGGGAYATSVTQLGLDGTIASYPLDSGTLTGFTHNIDPGKVAYLAEFSEAVDSDGTPDPQGTVASEGASVAEMTQTGGVMQQWDLATIISDYMRSMGDDPSSFVRLGTDWFHINSTTYDPSDNSLLVSSRENFVIKIDYATGAIRWIFGDPTKYWYTFPSLRAKALILAPGGLYPVGQHALSLTSDGLLMLFNDGAGSFSQPAGAPTGVWRGYSEVSAYRIQDATLSATEVWGFDNQQSIYSEVCSSAYEAPAHSILVDYAMANGGQNTRLVGLDSAHRVIFDFQYANVEICGAAWNAVPIALDHLTIAD